MALVAKTIGVVVILVYSTARGTTGGSKVANIESEDDDDPTPINVLGL